VDIIKPGVIAVKSGTRWHRLIVLLTSPGRQIAKALLLPGRWLVPVVKKGLFVLVLLVPALVLMIGAAFLIPERDVCLNAGGEEPCTQPAGAGGVEAGLEHKGHSSGSEPPVDQLEESEAVASDSTARAGAGSDLVNQQKVVSRAQEEPLFAPARPVTGRDVCLGEWQRHPVCRDWRYHPGLKIAAPAGSAVRAVEDGFVDSVIELGGGQTAVTVSHRQNFVSRYYPVERVCVHPGQSVRKGHELGEVAAGAEPPYIWFELKESGEVVDPRRYWFR